jgi:hypothetical protein
MRTVCDMRMLGALLTLSACLALAPARAADATPPDNPDRSGDFTQLTQAQLAAMDQRDQARRTEAQRLLRSGAVRTSRDYTHLAMLYQHGGSVDDIRLAYSFAWIAASLDPANKEARWLSAAAWDRLLVRQGRPQWYGTQFNKSSPESPWTIDPVEPFVTDEERARYGVPPLSESRKRLLDLNR